MSVTPKEEYHFFCVVLRFSVEIRISRLRIAFLGVGQEHIKRTPSLEDSCTLALLRSVVTGNFFSLSSLFRAQFPTLGLLLEPHLGVRGAKATAPAG